MSATEVIREAPSQGEACKLTSKNLGEKVHLQTSSQVFAQPSEYNRKDVFESSANSSKLLQNLQSPFEKVATGTDLNTLDTEQKGAVDLCPPAAFHGKRKLSLSLENNNKKVPKKRRKTVEKSNVRTVSKFLLGGNINDPLNLNSLVVDEEVSKIANAQTPISSPLPERNKDPDPVIVPQDLRDPLKLNSDTDESNPNLTRVMVARKRKRRNSFRNSKADDRPTSFEDDARTMQRNLEKDPLTIDVRPQQTKHPVVDKIVSPVIPEACRKRKHKRKSDPSPTVSKVLLSDAESKSHAPVKAKEKKGSHHKSPEKSRGHASEEMSLPKFRNKGAQYQYGNYIGYYGYRNADRKDVRLTYFRKQWFEGKVCLDIGCNTGHVTLFVAKTFHPSKIVGIDIDAKLINLARKNVHQCLEEMVKSKSGVDVGKFPVSMKKCYGAIPALKTQSKEGHGKFEEKAQDLFPGNVLFRCGNYVLSKDELLKSQKEEYDTILCLSITKWIHLNWGDDGLKRFFRRIYLALRPGGVFILEPQAWPSYVKKKKMTETTYRNFYKIKFKPHEFKRFLLKDVGFSTCEVIGTPVNESKGFRRQLLLFKKLTQRPPDASIAKNKGHSNTNSSSIDSCSSLPSSSESVSHPVRSSHGIGEREVAKLNEQSHEKQEKSHER